MSAAKLRKGFDIVVSKSGGLNIKNLNLSASEEQVSILRYAQDEGGSLAAYLLSMKSALASPETATGFDCVFEPSCQAVTLYCPSGTFSIL